MIDSNSVPCHQNPGKKPVPCGTWAPVHAIPVPSTSPAENKAMDSIDDFRKKKWLRKLRIIHIMKVNIMTEHVSNE